MNPIYLNRQKKLFFFFLFMLPFSIVAILLFGRVDAAESNGSNLEQSAVVQPVEVGQAVILVTSFVDNLIAGDGFCTIREAINNANQNIDTTSGDCVAGTVGLDTISFFTGVYQITISGAGDDGNLSGDFDITDDLFMNGFGATTFDGNGLDRVFHVINGNVTISGIRFANGTAPFGGGIANTGVLTLSAAIVDGNTATIGGGGVANLAGGTINILAGTQIINNVVSFGNGGGLGNDSASLAVIDNASINNNSATLGQGGGIANSNSSSILMQNSSLSENSADAAGSFGGGVYNADSIFVLNNSLVTTNTSGFGGAIYNNNGQMGSSSAFFRDNVAVESGGALFNNNSTLLLNSPIFFYNSSQNSGGGAVAVTNGTDMTVNGGGFVSNDALVGNGGALLIDSSAFTMTRAAVISNSAAGIGGGIMLLNGIMTVDNLTLSGNSSSSGGGIDTDNSATTAVHVTVANNSPDGVAVRNGSTFNLASSILAGNGGINCTNVASTISSFGYNVEDVNSCNLVGLGDMPLTDPMLDPLANNGGNTWTHAVLAGTAAFNMIPFGGNGCGTSILLDQRNTARPQNGSCEPGAYEKALVYVDKDATGSSNGTSWTDAIVNLQNALMFAPANSEIWVADGSYYPDLGFVVTNDDRTVSFQLRNSVEIYGGFAATETMLIERDWVNNITVLSGDIDNETLPDTVNANGVVSVTTDITGSNSFSVIDGSGTDGTAVLDGFIINAGFADGSTAFPSPDKRGGGLYINNGSPLLRNVQILANAAPGSTGSDGFGGGAYFVNGAAPFMLDIEFKNNVAGDSGGGLYNSSADPMISQAVFRGNSGISFGGGAIYNAGSSAPFFDAITVENNDAFSRGGGIYNSSGTNTVITNSMVMNNNAPYGGGIYSRFATFTFANSLVRGNGADWGAGIYEWNNNSTLVNTIIEENLAAAGGGGAYLGQSTTLITDSTFQNNQAGTQCAGINGEDSAITILNSAILTNSLVAGGGGGICVLNITGGFAPTLVLSRSVVAGNSAVSSGGGVLNQSIPAAGSYTTAIMNSTISNNSATDGAGVRNLGTGVTVIDQSTIDNNMAINDGGGIKNITSTLVIVNSTVSTNNSNVGGGIWNNGSLNLTHVTVASNTAVLTGGGLFNEVGSTPMLTSTIVVYSGNNDCAGLAPVSNDYNVDSDNSCLLTQLNDMGMIDPLLGQLMDNGGDTETHAVPTFSPIIDAVPVGVNGCGVEIGVDQREVGREQASGCEPGAYETVGNSAPIATIDVYATGKNDPLIITGTGVLSNDIDYNNDPITVTVYTTPNFGSVTVDPVGSFVFTPAVGFIGRASFFYTMTDGIATDSAKVVIDVYEVVATLDIDDGGAGTVKLAWNTDNTVCDYKVYRNTAPYGGFSLVAVIPAANDYDDPGAIGDSVTNYYYYVEANCLGAYYLNNTNKTGAFDFSVEPGS